MLEFFKYAFYFIGVLAFFAIFISCIIYIDTCNILEICYCPNCGIDLRQGV